LRHTFSHVRGSSAATSRFAYQEATIGMQPEVNFHYRPLWQPEFELYDKHRTGVW